MRVLVIEPDPLMRERLKEHLGLALMACDTTENSEGLEHGELDYDVVLLSATPGDRPGLEALRALHSRHRSIPVIMHTDSNDFEYRVKALDTGADDVMVRPLNRRELIARIRAVARRGISCWGAGNIVTTGRMNINLNRRTVEIDDQPVHIPRQEFNLLAVLAERKGRMLSKEQLISHLYDDDCEPSHKIIDIFVHNLRRRLAQVYPPARAYIATSWGRGVCLVDHPAPGSSPTLRVVA